MAQGARQTADGSRQRQTGDGRQKPCEFVSACISARGGREGVKVNPIQAINACKTCSHVHAHGAGGDFLHGGQASIHVIILVPFGIKAIMLYRSKLKYHTLPSAYLPHIIRYLV